MAHEVNKPKSVFEDLDKGINPGTGQPTPPATGGLATMDARPAPANAPALDLLGLITLLTQQNALLASQAALQAKKEAREEAKYQEEQERISNREKQRSRTAKGQEKGSLLKQAKCRHMKGGKHANRVDYALAKHLFISRKVYIVCLICKMKWFPGDTKEFLIRGTKKQKVSNYTHLGWAEVSNLFAQSSNTQTMSEVPLGSIDTEGINISTDASGLEVDLSLRDEAGNIVEGIQY